MSNYSLYFVTLYRINKGIKEKIIGTGKCEGSIPDPPKSNYTVTVTNAKWESSLAEGGIAVGVFSLENIHMKNNKISTTKEFIVMPVSGGGIAEGTDYTRKVCLMGGQFPAKVAFHNDFGSYHGDDYFKCHILDGNINTLLMYPGGSQWPFELSAGINLDVFNRNRSEDSGGVHHTKCG